MIFVRSVSRDERALPAAVFGPRLKRPLLRLASRLASVITMSGNQEYRSLFVLAASHGLARMKFSRGCFVTEVE
jgi:hypothetical protein